MRHGGAHAGACGPVDPLSRLVHRLVGRRRRGVCSKGLLYLMDCQSLFKRCSWRLSDSERLSFGHAPNSMCRHELTEQQRP